MIFTKFPEELWSYLFSPTEIAVMLRILRLTGFAGNGECFESSDSFAAKIGITRRTLSKVLKDLESRKLIVVHRQRHKLNRIALGTVIQNMTHVGKNFPHIENTNIYMGEKFSHIETETERRYERWLKKTNADNSSGNTKKK
jgi:DNA-binding HxlR family transcriptional regulator